MFSPSFSRILWKEYRIHRPLWLSCLGIGFALQFYFVLAQSMNVWSSEVTLRRPLAVIAIMLPIMYAVGCAAILFAGEREERTTDWLLALSAPPIWTLAAKLACAIVSIVGMQFILLFPALLSADNPKYPTSMLQLSPPFALVVFVWAMLGSLLSRRVLTSVVVMAGCFVLTAFVPAMLIESAAEYFRGPVLGWDPEWHSRMSLLIGILLVGIAIDLWLGMRWCQGRFLDGITVEGWVCRISDSVALRQNWPFEVSRLPVRIEFEQPWRRAWQRLVWQERRRERGHVLVMAMGIVLAAVSGVASRLNGDNYMIPLVAFIVAIPLVMGVLSFRSDSSWQQPRFLFNRGIAPGSIWLAKQLTWLPRPFVITGIVFFAALLCEWMLIIPRDFGPPSSRSPYADIYKFVQSRPHVLAWQIIAGYCAGQLAACIFRGIVIAGAMGVALNVSFVAWIETSEYLGLPSAWFIGLPLVATLLVTLWQSKSWLMEDYSWRRILRLTITLAAIPVSVASGAMLYRSIEIAPAPSNSYTEMWRDLRPGVPESLSATDQLALRRLVEIQELPPDEFERSTDEIVAVLHGNLNSLHDPKATQLSSFSQQILNRISVRLTNVGQELGGADEIEKAFECLLADLKLNRLLATHNTLFHWKLFSERQRQTLNLIVDLANHPLQTSASVRKMRQTVEDELNRFPAAHEAIVVNYDDDCRQWINTSTSEFVRNLQLEVRQPNGNPPPLLWVTIALVREPLRLEALTKRESQIAFSRILAVETHLASALDSKPISEAITGGADIDATKEWARTTVLSRLTSRPLAILDTHIEQIYARVATNRAALIRLEIISYRIEHGQLPAKLIDLAETLNGNQLVDPFSNRPFEYYPAFLLSAGVGDQSIRPTSSTDAELISNKTPIAEFTIAQLTSTVTDRVKSVIHLLQSTGPARRYLYAIPPSNVVSKNP